MNIGVDAAALGMSNAVTAFSGDVNSGYWNPAGILKIEDIEVGFMHASYFANIAQYDYAGFAMPIDDRSAWGISLIRFGDVVMSLMVTPAAVSVFKRFTFFIPWLMSFLFLNGASFSLIN